MSESIANMLVERTGEGVGAWNARIREQGVADEPALRAWLTEKGVTGYPQMLLVYERFGYPDYLTASADELVEGQYADRRALRPILDAVLARLPAIGDVSVQTRKTYVAWSRRGAPSRRSSRPRSFGSTSASGSRASTRPAAWGPRRTSGRAR